MTLYVDTSALLKRYVDEPDSNDAERWLASDDELVTGWHTIVEVRRNLARRTRARPLAATIAEQTGVRTLAAMHLGAARRLGGPIFLTFDVRHGHAARAIGLPVVGA